MEIMEEMMTSKVDVLRIGEIRNKWSGEIKLDKGYTMFYTGVAPRDSSKEGV